MDRTPRFRGEMMSLTGVADSTTDTASSQTALGMDGRIGDTWQIGFRGNLHRIDDPTSESYGEPLAQSSVAQLEVRSSPTNAYRVATTNSSWRYAPQSGDLDNQADIHAHNFEWEHGDARVQVRYLAQQNLFLATPGSELVEIAGNTTVMQTEHSDVGVFIRVAQESVRNAASDVVRTADLTANATLELVPSFVIHYGMSSRLSVAGTAVRTTICRSSSPANTRLLMPPAPRKCSRPWWSGPMSRGCCRGTPIRSGSSPVTKSATGSRALPP